MERVEQDDRTRRWLGPRFHGVSTAVAPPRERFDFWHSLFGDVEMAPLAGGGRPYGAAALACSGDDGVIFTDLACDPTAAHFRGDEGEYMRLNVLTEGRIEVTHGDDRREIVAPGAGIVLFDYSRASRADSPTGYRNYLLTVPRALVHRAMGGDPIGGRAALRKLPETPLSLLLKAQLDAFARHGPGMDAHESEAAMRSLSGLATAYLERFAAKPAEESGSDDALFAAACRHVEAHRASPALTAGAVARALGCSRAGLYRLFERRGLAVTEHIRNARLNHGRALLRDPRLDIGDVALRCGYADSSAFGKAFRRRFGMTPRDWRMTIG